MSCSKTTTIQSVIIMSNYICSHIEVENKQIDTSQSQLEKRTDIFLICNIFDVSNIY